MSRHRSARRRAHRRPIHIELDSECFAIWFPPADDPIEVLDLGDATGMAFDMLDTEAQREVLVLLDERRRVTALVIDPPAQIGVLIGVAELPGLDVPFCQTLSIVLCDEVVDGPPAERDRAGYLALRRIHMLQGLQLLDVLLVDPERVQSLAVACDPDPVWFDEFRPIDAT
jgi:hypothetical protein